MKKKKFFFFLRFLKNRPILRPNLAGEFRRPKGPPFGKKTKSTKKGTLTFRFFSVFISFFSVFLVQGEISLCEKKKKRNGPNYTELDRTVRVPPLEVFFWCFYIKKKWYGNGMAALRQHSSMLFDPYRGQEMAKNPRKRTLGAQIVPNFHHIPTQTPQKHDRKSS